MDLLVNPFYVLDARAEDDRRRIMELAEERSLTQDAAACMAARAELTNPRKRLTAEVAWLPGVDTERVDDLMNMLQNAPDDLADEDDLPAMARANLLAAGLRRLDDPLPGDLVDWIQWLAQALDEVEPDELMESINEQRNESGFPEVIDIAAVETEIQSRRRECLAAVRETLSRFGEHERLNILTKLVAAVTDDGETECPVLVADLVNAHEVETQQTLQDREERIESLAERVQQAVADGRPDPEIRSLLDTLVKEVKDWDTLAQPVQLGARSQGLKHEPSHRVAGILRNLSLRLHNDHGKWQYSQILTGLMQEVFAEVDAVAERAAEDAEALAAIADRRSRESALEPLLTLCTQALQRAEANPSAASREAQQVIDAAPRLLQRLREAALEAHALSEMEDAVAITLLRCAILYGNETRSWAESERLLQEALTYAHAPDLRQRIDQNLTTVRGNMFLVAGSNMPSRTGSGILGPLAGPVGCLAVIFLVGLISSWLGGLSGGDSSARSTDSQPASSTTPYTDSSYNTYSYRDALRAEIEQGKERIAALEAEITRLDSRLASMKSEMNNALLMGDARGHDYLVPEYNRLVQHRNNYYQDYSRLIDEVNAKVNEYNASRR